MGLIHSIANRYHVYGYDHDDLVQEGLTKLWEVYREFNNEYAETTFITTVLKNHYVDLLLYCETQKRKNYDKNGKALHDIKDFDFTDYTIDPPYSKVEYDMVDRCYQGMNDSDYKDILFDVLDGMTYREVGEKYELSYQRIGQIWNEFIDDIKQGGTKE